MSFEDDNNDEAPGEQDEPVLELTIIKHGDGSITVPEDQDIRQQLEQEAPEESILLNRQEAEEWARARQISSLALDLSPVMGDLKGILEAIQGKNPITGETLAWWERALGAVPIGGSGHPTGAQSCQDPRQRPRSLRSCQSQR
jgi:hypothetical protein